MAFGSKHLLDLQHKAAYQKKIYIAFKGQSAKNEKMELIRSDWTNTNWFASI